MNYRWSPGVVFALFVLCGSAMAQSPITATLPITAEAVTNPITSPLISTSIVTASLHTQETAPEGKYVQALNVRQWPGTDYERVGSISQFEVVEVLGLDEATGWVRVQLEDGTVGFVNRSYLRLPEGVDLRVIPAEEIAAIALPTPAPEAPAKVEQVEQVHQPQQPEASAVVESGNQELDPLVQDLAKKILYKDKNSKYAASDEWGERFNRANGFLDEEAEFVLNALQKYIVIFTPEEKRRLMEINVLGVSGDNLSHGGGGGAVLSTEIIGRTNEKGFTEGQREQLVCPSLWHELQHIEMERERVPQSEQRAYSEQAKIAQRLVAFGFPQEIVDNYIKAAQR